MDTFQFTSHQPSKSAASSIAKYCTLLGLIGLTNVTAMASETVAVGPKSQVCRALFGFTAQQRIEKSRKGLDNLVARAYSAPFVTTYTALKSYDGLRSLALISKGDLYADILETLQNEEASVESEIIYRLLSLPINKDNTTLKVKDLIQANLEVVYSEIIGNVHAKERVQKIFDGTIKISDRISLEDSRQFIFGDDSSSLLSQFYREAQEILGTNVKSIETTFPATQDRAPLLKFDIERNQDMPRDAIVHARRFVGVDSRTIGLYYKYFLKNPLLFAHFHTSGQGTLNVAYRGQTGTYSSMTNEIDPTRLANNTGLILPTIVFSSTEASRFSNFFALGNLDRTRAMYPWTLGEAKEDGNIERYCKASGYTSCTHWMANIPVGDQIVKSFEVPGYVDMSSASGTNPYSSNDPRNKLPRKGPVGTYSHYYSNTANSSKIDSNYGAVRVENETRLDRLTRIVWTEGKSAAPLWQVLGLRESQINGELANPGFLAHSLMAASDPARVPVVFFVRPDSGLELTNAEVQALTSNIMPQ